MTTYPKQSSIYWFDPEPVRGSEISKIRPCIVISPNEMNQHLNTVIIVPLTSKIGAWPFRLTLNILGKKASAACDQVRAIDKTRLIAYVQDLKPIDTNKLFKILSSIFST